MFKRNPPPEENVEKAFIKDDVGIWEIDIDHAFSEYRNNGDYLYHGPIVMNGHISHIFYFSGVHEWE